MSVTDGGSGQEPGAVPVGTGGGEGGTDSDRTDQPSRLEAQARAEEIHAEVARTEARRAEEQAARADEAVDEAQSRQQAAHQAQEEARRHAQEAREDAQGAVERASGSSSTLARGRSGAGDGAGDPIVFGPFTAERPELLVAAAFVGGFLLAKIIRGLAS